MKAALARLKPEVALYVGGMGHKDKNFHKDQMVRRGFGGGGGPDSGTLSGTSQGRGDCGGA